MSKKGIDQLKGHEGYRDRPYKCTSNKWTIGYGRNLEDRGLTKKEVIKLLKDIGISQGYADWLLSNDIKDFCTECQNEFEILPELNTPRKWVIYNMAFNMGIDRLKKFKKMFKAMDDKFYIEAAKQMLDSKWAVQVGNRANQLSEQMRMGEWQ